MSTRRHFIRIAGAATVALPFAGACKLFASGNKTIPVDAHIWVYASRYPPDWDCTPILDIIFNELSYAGYSGVEIMEPILRHDDAVEKLKELQQKYSIPLSGTSYHAHMYKKEEQQRILEDIDLVTGRLSQAGGNMIGISVGDAGRKKTEDELDAQALLLQKIMKVCEKNKVQPNLHNHTYEMEYDMFDFKGTIARVPDMKLGPDLNWLVRAKVDPVWFIKTYGDKMVFMHLRDQGVDGKWTEALGEGITDFEAIAKALKDIGYNKKAAVELAFDSEPVNPVRESWKKKQGICKKNFWLVNNFDAIVIGSGMSGGWAAKELCEHGLKTLVLERGRNVEHIKDYPTANKKPWEFAHRGALTEQFIKDNPVISKCYAFDDTTQHFFVKDKEHPYIQTKPFDWIRGYQVGGKSLLWARWTQRWSDLDFEANAKQGIAVDWPIRYKDIAPWYSYVEKFVGISGNRDGIPHLPDGEFQPPMEMNCVEKHLKQSIESNFEGRHLIISRTANLTRGLNGRGPCQYRNLCSRGCPYSAYFSSNSATLPAANATGNLTLMPHSVVHSIIFDEDKQRAKGVRVINAETGTAIEYFAKIIFVNGGTVNSTMLLLNSTSKRFPNGMGNDSGVLGHYLMDHNYRGRLNAEYEGYRDQYHFGRRPAGVYIPRFRNVGKDTQKEFLRGFAYAAGGQRRTGNNYDATIGGDLKQAMSEAGPWEMWMTGMGEHLPYFENKISLSKTEKDKWGVPLVEIDCEYKSNEDNMTKNILESGAEMFDKAGFKNIQMHNSLQAPGLAIHEMGTARMGRDAKTSVLNGHNQVWGAPNVFVTDGACMTSNACQNPSLTYMAMTARAANYAVEEMKKRNL